MKCSNCNGEMIKDYEIKIYHAAIMTYIALVKGKEKKKLKAYVCPKCSKVEFYSE